MRFIIRPEHGEDIVLTDTTNGQSIGWYLINSVVEGWFGTPSLRESVKQAVAHDGDGYPSTFTQGARVVTFYGAIDCPSSIEAAQEKNRLNALFGQRLEIIGDDADGTKHCFGYLSDDPQPKYLPGQRIVTFSLVITCPYPIKVGDEIEYEVNNGYCYVSNAGNARSYPKIKVTGNVTAVTASFDGHVFSWSGDANLLEIDTMDASATSGEVVSDDAFSVPPGESFISVSVTPSSAKAYVVLASAWR